MTSYQKFDSKSSRWDELLSQPFPETQHPIQSFGTKAIHEGQEPESLHGAINVPIYYSTTFKQHEPGVFYSKYDYSRVGNPTVDALNACLASLEQGKYGLSFSSGSGATSAIVATLKAGDHVILTESVYGGTNILVNKVFGKFGLEVSIIDLTPATLEAAVRKNTKLVWIESPTNPTLKIFDIEGLCAVARKHGFISVVDNTFATPYLQSPLLLGADIAYHSCSKYISGNSDVIAGAIVTNNKELYEAIAFNAKSMGPCISPMDAYLLLRSVRTLSIRVEAQCRNANVIARYLQSHAKVSKVYFPGLESHPGHAIAKRQMRNFGGMISFVLKGDLETTKLFIKNLKVITLARSLGAVESLLECAAVMSHKDMPKEEKEQLGISDSLMRMSIGIENIEDLLDDLEHALSVI